METILLFFAKYIEAELGIVYSEHNYFQLQNRLEDIAKALSLSDVEALYRSAQPGIKGELKALLLDYATNNETSFFRDPNVFKAVESLVLPEYSARPHGAEPIRIWSAASSTGQEALSVAMLISEWSDRKPSPVSFEITGTDISQRALAKAKSAAYSEFEVQRGLSPLLLKKFFAKNAQERWVADARLTKNIRYESLNLKDQFRFPAPFDLILCRNVLIYQNVDGKKAILEKVATVLKPGGYLIMGSGESLLGLTEDYEKAAADGAIIYRYGGVRAARAA